MTNKEAIETIEANYPPENYSMLRETLDMAIALMKKQEAVKIKVYGIFYDGRCGRCPNCHIELNENDCQSYCGYCGQKVKWE